MPKIRDWTWQYGTSTSATTIACALPSYQQNDLLLAVCSADTGTTQAWSASGWTQYLSQSNTSNLAIMYKIASASETAPTFTYSSSETADVRLLSIMDIDTTTPFAANSNLSTAAARVAMSTVVTTRDNSLILYMVATSAVSVPEIIEGAVTLEMGSDGTAHSDGLSWGFQAKAGTTPSNIYMTNISASAAIAFTVAINPPSGGATVIPSYCAGDLSIYIDPINGTSAYNGNTAFAATTTTYFGSTLAGNPLGNGTAAAATDVGINSFHSMGQLTGVVTDGTYSGSTLVLATANKPSVAGKNILLHVKTSTPKVIQTTDPITKATTKGLVFGMCSVANTDYKVWHVHGAGTAWDSASHLPIVINSNATGGLIQNTGTLNAASILAFGVAISGFTIAPIWQFGSLWVLDTTTIAGGNAVQPVDIGGIWKVCSSGKERMSVLQQGASQALVLQPIQFGNGGTDALYLDLRETAIEFPQQYNVTSRNIFYCSADNVAGLTYYAGATDTIIHKNAVVSSKSKFHWRISALSSTSATYDFSGLSIIGAGDVVLRAVTTFNKMSFTTCPSITQNGALITNSTFTNSQISMDNLGQMSGCTHISTATGYAIIITTPGTYTFTNNVFTGYGAAGTTNAAIYNNSGGAVTINVIGGSGITVKNGTSATTTLVINPVTTLITVKDINTGAVLVGARVYLATSGGALGTGVVIFNALTNTSGQVSDTRSYISDQPVTGRVRFSTSPNLYKTVPISETISSTSGLTLNISMIPDV